MTPDNSWNPERYSRESRFVRDGGLPVLSALQPRPGERVLDLGCGPGQLTRAIADAGASVLGLDASEAMIAEARAAYPALDFRVGRGEALEFEREFDAVFSNAALHWMLRADDVAAGMFRALVPGGRLVAEFGGHDNIAGVRHAVDLALEELGVTNVPRPFCPWYFPRLGTYASLLERHGFTVRNATCFARPSPMPDQDGKSGLRAWLEIFSNELLTAVGAAQREPFLDAVERHARPRLFRDGVWWIDYVRLRIEAVAAEAER